MMLKIGIIINTLPSQYNKQQVGLYVSIFNEWIFRENYLQFISLDFRL
jgi:hypothetical protein